MQAAAVPPRPLKISVEIDYAQAGPLLAQVLTTVSQALAPRAHPTTPLDPARGDQADDPAPPRPPGPDPPLPVASRQQSTVPTALPEGTMLGAVCKRAHTYQGRRQSLRRVSNGKCIECLRQQERPRKPPRSVTTTPVLVAPLGDRPPLPSHWAERGFLSPIPCLDAQQAPRHRYRDTAYTLRYTDSERCVQCCTDANPALALAGD
jgi:hypothetical protein